jgi:hypothetical protein
MGREESIGEVTNPFALVVGIGTLVWIVSALGVFGAACSKSFESAAERTGMRRLGSRALLIYYVLILGICSGLLYAMFLCFLFAEKVLGQTDFRFACDIAWPHTRAHPRLSSSILSTLGTRVSRTRGRLDKFSFRAEGSGLTNTRASRQV